jgi:hypothetical protein
MNKMDTKQIQKEIEEYDKIYSEHIHSELADIRHVTLHLGKLMAKLCEYCEKQEHGQEFPTTKIEHEVIPDLLIYSVRLANRFNIDISKAFKERQNVVKKKRDAALEMKEK